MKKLILATIFSLFSMQFAAANPQTAMIEGMIERMRATIASDCADEAALSCMDVTTAQCIKIRTGILENCSIPALKKITEFTAESAAKLESENLQCSIEYASEKHDIDPELFMSCID